MALLYTRAQTRQSSCAIDASTTGVDHNKLHIIMARLRVRPSRAPRQPLADDPHGHLQVLEQLRELATLAGGVGEAGMRD